MNQNGDVEEMKNNVNLLHKDLKELKDNFNSFISNCKSKVSQNNDLMSFEAELRKLIQKYPDIAQETIIKQYFFGNTKKVIVKYFNLTYYF